MNNSDNRIILSNDFAIRTIHRAEIIFTRRRRFKQTLYGSIITFVLILTTFTGLLNTDPQQPSRIASNTFTRVSMQNDWEFAAYRQVNSTAMQYFFPDAAPLSQFIIDYNPLPFETNIDIANIIYE